jgi:hypothetical protein
MSKGCEMCGGSGVVFKPGMLGLDDKDTCPECEGKGNAPLRTNPSEIAPETPQPVEGEQVDLAQQSGVIPHYQWTNPEVLTLRAEVERLKQQYAEEVDEFNAGYQAARDGLGEDAEPNSTPHDVWRCGYAWGKFEALKVEVNRLQEANVFALSENARMKNALEEIEQVGHNPAHLACDLMDEHPGMEDRLWALVNRLANMANQQVCIAHENRKALYCNEGPQGSNWFDVMARLRHAILPEINADSTFFTIGQVRTLVAEIEKLESLVAEANSELAGVTDIYRRAYTAIGACDISNFLAKCEQAAGFEQREHDLESIIKDLRHELDRSRNAHGKAELELARFRTTLASIEEYGTEEINAGIELRQENERLRKIINDAQSQ